MRCAEISRVTKETEINVSLCLEGGELEVSTGIGFFDHMLSLMLFYAGFGAKISVKGDLHIDAHHSVEDTGIVLGSALKQALGDKRGIERFASAYVPMDESLAHTALDLSGRPFLHYEAELREQRCGDFDNCLSAEFLRAFSNSAALTLHCRVLYGENSHHMNEAMFKSIGMALKTAVRVSGDAVPSTKGIL